MSLRAPRAVMGAVVLRILKSAATFVGVFAAVLMVAVLLAGLMYAHGLPMDENGIATGPPSDLDQVRATYVVGGVVGLVLGAVSGVTVWRRSP